MPDAIKAAGTDVDLYEEDGYLAGLADQFLHTERIDVDAIHIRRSIDRAIAERTGANHRELRDYRSLMLDLAAALSDATGVPITGAAPPGELSRRLEELLDLLDGRVPLWAAWVSELLGRLNAWEDAALADLLDDGLGAKDSLRQITFSPANGTAAAADEAARLQARLNVILDAIYAELESFHRGVDAQPRFGWKQTP